MGLIQNLGEAVSRQHTPKVDFVSPAKEYKSSSGRQVTKDDLDLCVRAVSLVSYTTP